MNRPMQKEIGCNLSHLYSWLEKDLLPKKNKRTKEVKVKGWRVVGVEGRRGSGVFH